MTYTVSFFATDGVTPVTLPGMHVIVRPDEVILRASDIGRTATKDFDPFIARLYKDGVQVDMAGFPTLYTYTDYKFLITPDSIALGGTPAELIAAELVPPVGVIDPSFPPGPVPPQVWTGPNSEAGIPPYEGATGESYAINPVFSEMEAEYLCTGKPNDMWAWSRGSDAMPIFQMDPNTGKPVDLRVHMFATTYWNQTGGKYFKMPSAPPGCPVLLDDAHHASTDYVSAISGLKWRDLETLQYTATWYLTWSAFYSAAVGYPVLDPGQTRADAQARRSLLMCLRATQYFEEKLGPVPDYLYGSSYWESLVDYDVKFLTDFYMHGPAARFGQVCNVGCSPIFMDEMVNMSMGLALLWFPAKYRAVAEWKFTDLYNRIGGGPWPERYPVPYRLEFGPHLKDEGFEFPGVPTARQKDGTIVDIATDLFATMKEVWDWHAQQGLATGNVFNMTKPMIQALLDDPNGALTFVSWDPTAATYSHTAMALYIDAARKGKITLPAGAEQAYARNHERVLNLMRQSNYRVPYRHSFNVMPQPIGAQPPPVITPPPATPPPTEINMPTARSIKIGETVSLPIVSNPSDADLSSLTLKVTPDGICSAALVKDANGRPVSVTAKGLASGLAKIIGDVSGLDAGGAASVIEAECDVTVTAPLPLARGLTIG